MAVIRVLAQTGVGDAKEVRDLTTKRGERLLDDAVGDVRARAERILRFGKAEQDDRTDTGGFGAPRFLD